MQTTEEKTTQVQQDEMLQNSAQCVKDRETAIIGLIRNQCEVLNDALEGAKLRYAESELNEEDWKDKVDRKIQCKSLEAQIYILHKLENDFTTMFSLN